MSSERDTHKVRLDVWLWRARVYKTRSQAAAAVFEGRVRLVRGGASSVATKPAVLVGPGDGLVVSINRRMRVLEIVAVGERRGPPAEARGLFQETGSEVGEEVADGFDDGARDQSDDPHA